MTKRSPISARTTGLRSARYARSLSCCAAPWGCSPRRASLSTGASSRRSTIATVTSRGRKWSGVGRYLSQLDTADLQEPSEALAAKTAHLKEKLAKLESEMQSFLDADPPAQ